MATPQSRLIRDRGFDAVPLSALVIPITDVVIVIAMLAASVADMPQAITVGPTSGLGALTIALGMVTCAGALSAGPYPTRLLIRMLPYLGLLSWIGLSVLRAPLAFWGFQNVILYVLFGSLIVVAGTGAARHGDEMHRLIDWCIVRIDWVAIGAIVLNLASFGLPTEKGIWWVGPRSIALLGMIPLSWHLAGWYYGAKRSAAAAVMWMAAIAVTLSRMAMAISLVLLCLMCLLQLRFRPRQARYSATFLVLALVIVGALLEHSNPFRERVFSGDRSLQVGSMTINTEGRLEIWTVVTASAWEHPVIGKGVGSSQTILGPAFSGIQEPGHPHNDYLRLWHDLGAVGLFLFMVATVGWLVTLLRVWWRAESARRSAPLQLAAAMALLAVLLAMATDNVIVYIFVMAPAGVLIGAGLGGDGDVPARDASPSSFYQTEEGKLSP